MSAPQITYGFTIAPAGGFVCVPLQPDLDLGYLARRACSLNQAEVDVHGDTLTHVTDNGDVLQIARIWEAGSTQMFNIVASGFTAPRPIRMIFGACLLLAIDSVNRWRGFTTVESTAVCKELLITHSASTVFVMGGSIDEAAR